MVIYNTIMYCATDIIKDTDKKENGNHPEKRF